MNKIEKELVKKVKEVLPELEKRYEENKHKYTCQNVEYGILIDGVIDGVLRTPKGWYLKAKFATKGIIQMEGLSHTLCKCDDYEIREYKLKSI